MPNKYGTGYGNYASGALKGRGSGVSPVSPKSRPLVPVTVRDLNTPTSRVDPVAPPTSDYARNILNAIKNMGGNSPNPKSGSTGSGAAGSPFSQTGINVVPPQENVAPAVPPIPAPDPIGDAYKALFGQLDTVRARNTGDIDKALFGIRGAFNSATQQNTDMFGRNMDEINAMAKALGADFATTPQGIDFNTAARQRQEIADLNMAGQIAAVEALRALQGGVFDVARTTAEQAKAKSISDSLLLKQAGEQAMAELMAGLSSGGGGGGGGGGGRRGGGRKSSSTSGSLTETADETSYINDAGDFEIAQALKAMDPAAFAFYDRAKTLGGGSSTDGLTEIQKLIDLNIPKTYTRRDVFTNTAGNRFTGGAGNLLAKFKTNVSKKSSQANKKSLERAKEALYLTSGFYGNPKTTQKTNTKGTSKTKK